jgi:crotonobetaine/carnitine-CoA ligase
VKFSTLIQGLPASGGVVFGAERVSALELLELSYGAAADLRQRGAVEGERCAVMIDNSLALLVAWLGAALAGAQFVPINTRLRGEVLRFILKDARAAVVLADASHAATIEACGAGTGVIESGTWLGGLRHLTAAPMAGTGGGCMIYTSGTTGRPKGVVWTSETQAIHATSYASELVPLAADEHAYSCLPLFHVTCMGVTMATLLQGATVHIDPRFSLSAFWSRITETGAVFFPYVGTILSMLLKDDRPAPSHRVRFAMGAAAPLEVYQGFERRFGVRLLETWGQTETASIWLANHDRVPGSIGRSCPRADFRVVPIEGVASDGELQVRPVDSHSMMSGYHANPDASAAAWDGEWYRTRDLVNRDAAGNFFFAGRLADCLRRRGENVSAYEVELAVLKCPDVLEAAVVGVPSAVGEEDIALYYVPRADGSNCSPQALDAWCREALSDFMVPRYYCAVDEFPKTETQRIQKGILHDQIKLRGAYDAERKETRP